VAIVGCVFLRRFQNCDYNSDDLQLLLSHLQLCYVFGYATEIVKVTSYVYVALTEVYLVARRIMAEMKAVCTFILLLCNQ